MYLPRPLLSTPYTRLLTATHPSSPPLLILTALTVDALCATRILTSLLKRDFIPHKIRPVSGYADLQLAGAEEVRRLRRGGDEGGEGGTVVCIGCGGGVDLGDLLGLSTPSGEADDESEVEEPAQGHGVEVWVIDAHRGWNLDNLFSGSASLRGVREGRLLDSYRSGAGGVVVWDAGEIETELLAEREAYLALQGMPEITEADLLAAEEEGDDEGEEEHGAVEGAVDDRDEAEPNSSQSRKRKASPTVSEAEDSSDERPARRRRSNSGTPIASSPGTSFQRPAASPGTILPSSPPAARELTQRQLRKQLLKLRRKHEATLERYYARGSWTGEPVSSMLYSLASELGREDTETLWLAIVGVESVALSPLTTGQETGSGSRRGHMTRLEMVKSVLRDEVRRLNPVSETDLRRGGTSQSDLPATARSATDTSIRLSPEPAFLLLRHWSLLDSMAHTPLLATRLHLWHADAGRKRLHKLLAKMGISLSEAGKGYLHLDKEVKRTLGGRVGKWGSVYGLDGLVPGEDDEGRKGWGFVRSWGWRATLSAGDVVTVVSAILEVGPSAADGLGQDMHFGSRDSSRESSYNHRQRRGNGLPSPPHSSDSGVDDPAAGAAASGTDIPDWTTRRFFAAYDALSPSSSTTSHNSHNLAPSAPQQGLPALLSALPLAQHLARSILRTGSALLSKNAIRHLRSFRMGVVKEGPDVRLFCHPGALVKLAGWVAEAVGVLEAEKGRGGRKGDGSEALVLGCLDEDRGVYVVVGLGGGGMASAGDGLGKTKAEIKAREERRAQKTAEKAAKKMERARRKVERRQARRERDAANGDLDSGDEDGEGSDATESNASSDSSTSSSSGSDGDTDADATDPSPGGVRGRRKGAQRNRFGIAFQEVVAETGARVRIDSFEHSVVEVRKEDLAGFLEGLSLRAVVG
ncbi:DNA replication initiation factor cdc45 [Teratosphaeriaceae sp. CCFEE 6253]|nr:DNA replication initiation factor cdc45 [Teratosphaeriaceae sp. CCFEE 6253]